MSLTGRAAYLSLLLFSSTLITKLVISCTVQGAACVLEQAAVAVLTCTESPLPTRTELANM